MGPMKRVRYFFKIFFCSVIMSVAVVPCNAAPTMRFEPQRITVNDTFHLILSSDNGQFTPNLTPLQKEFTILGTERRFSYHMVNGQTTSNSEWVILLRPKTVGRLTIPAIKIGQEQTQAATIEVDKVGDSSMSSDSHQHDAEGVMLKTEVNTSSPYVNQEVLYTVKLFSNTSLINAAYHPPTVENALLIPLGDGRHYQTQLNGELYAVEEQQYAVFPQKSGKLTLHPPSFQATVYDQFPRQMTVEAKPTTLTVRPAPSDYQGLNWLPAENIALSETYDPAISTMREGDTLTRTVTLNAVAMPAQLLPTLKFEANDDFNAYPETPEVNNTVKQNKLLGTSTVKVTYLLNHAGRVTIPILEVPWFNIATGKTEIASLPAYTLMVDPAIQRSEQPQPSKTISSGLQKTNKTPKITHAPTVQSTPSLMVPKTLLWAFVMGFVAALGLVGVVWWLKPTGHHARQSAQRCVKRLKEACQKNQAILARDALLEWARYQWPEARILNLNDVGGLSRDAALKKQLMILTQALYHPNQTSGWQGAELWRSFNGYYQDRSKKKNRKKTVLPPINPV